MWIRGPDPDTQVCVGNLCRGTWLTAVLSEDYMKNGYGVGRSGMIKTVARIKAIAELFVCAHLVRA